MKPIEYHKKVRPKKLKTTKTPPNAQSTNTAKAFLPHTYSPDLAPLLWPSYSLWSSSDPSVWQTPFCAAQTAYTCHSRVTDNVASKLGCCTCLHTLRKCCSYWAQLEIKAQS